MLGIPLLLAAVTALALWTVSRVTVDKKNEMYIGSIGEPSTLNPVQAADSASGSVTGVIFNGLLKYNAGLEIVGDLAADLTAQLKDARQKSQTLIVDAEDEMDRLYRSALAAAQADVNASMESARRTIEAERQKAMEHLEGESDLLSELIVNRLLAAK